MPRFQKLPDKRASVTRYAKEGPDSWIVVPVDPWDVPNITAPTRDEAIERAVAAGYRSAT